MHDHIQSEWWRFEACTIENNALRPAPGALRHAYNPWECFNDVKGKYRTVPTLWGEFAELVSHVRADAIGRYQPSPKGASRILDWSNKYGFLGVLPSSVQMIVLPPTSEADEQDLAAGLTPGCLIQRRHVRIAGMWITHNDVEELWDNGFSSEAPYAVRKPARSSRFPPSQSLIWDWESLMVTIDENNARLRTFFSTPPSDGQYPLPLSKEFWAIYQEPLWAWMRAALMFADSVELVSQFAVNHFVGTTWPEERLGTVNMALWVLNSLAASESNFYKFGGSALRPQLACGSLLSAMARMFFEDVLDGRRARRCATCKKIFVSNERRSTYCSVKCRNTASMRRYRLRANEDPRRPQVARTKNA